MYTSISTSCLEGQRSSMLDPTLAKTLEFPSPVAFVAPSGITAITHVLFIISIVYFPLLFIFNLIVFYI